MPRTCISDEDPEQRWIIYDLLGFEEGMDARQVSSEYLNL